MKEKFLILVGFLAMASQVAALDAYLYFVNPTIELDSGDPNLPQVWREKKATKLVSFSGGLENSIDIGSIAAGGGAGRATFKEVSFVKPVDGMSAGMFSLLASGNHVDDAVVEVVDSMGRTIYKLELKLVLFQDISFEVQEADDRQLEKVVVQYGAQRMTTTRYLPNGTTDVKTAEWSRVLNQAQFAVQ